MQRATEGASRGKALARTAALAGLLLALSSVAVALGASAGQTSDFATPTAAGGPEGIAVGRDSNLWFIESIASKVGVINPVTHAFTEFSTPTAASFPQGIAAGPDGNLWFTEFNAGKIGEINPVTHAITEFPTPSAGSGPVDIAAGPDGNMWFAEFAANQIGEINPITHAISEFPTKTPASQPLGIAAGPDGNVWYTEKLVSRIGEINPTTHATSDFATPTASSGPNAITAGADGNLWFTESAVGKIGFINPTTLAENDFATSAGTSGPVVIAPGPDGNLWFTEGKASKIGVINPNTDVITNEFATPTTASKPQGIVAGPDGNLWFAENNAPIVSKVGFIGAGAPAPSITAPSISGSPQPGSPLTCQGATWSNWAGQQPSLTEYGFDGYQWLRDGGPVAGATSQSYAVAAGDVSHQLTCTTTVTYPLLQTTTSATSGAVTVSPPLAASLTTVSTSGDAASLTIACQGLPSQSCSGSIALSSHVTTQKGKTIAVAASAKKKKKKKPKPPPKKTTVVKVATGSYSVGTGKSVTAKLTLNSAGRKLLDQFYRLPSTVTIGGTTPVTKTVTLSYSRIRSPLSFTWTFNPVYTVAQSLTITGLPTKPKVTVICHGGGCPFGKRTFSAHGKTLKLASDLRHSHLRPHTTLELEITATNDVGKVAIFTIRSGRVPSLAESCLPPGAKSPSACA